MSNVRKIVMEKTNKVYSNIQTTLSTLFNKLTPEQKEKVLNDPIVAWVFSVYKVTEEIS